MKKDISLVDPAKASEEDSFYYNELTGKPYWDLRKMLGRQLFLIRQSYNSAGFTGMRLPSCWNITKNGPNWFWLIR